MIIDNNIISLMHFNNPEQLNYDECENHWNIYNTKLCIYDSNYKKFNSGSCQIIGYSYLFTKDIDIANLFYNNFTIDFWISIDKWVIEGGIFSCTINKDSGFSLITNKENETFELRFNSNNKITQFILKDSLKLNKWYHVAFSKNDEVLNFFIDGQLKNSFYNINFIGLSDTIILGNYHHVNPNSDNFKGHIDEFRIRNQFIYTINFIPPNSEYIKSMKFYFDLLYTNNVDDITLDNSQEFKTITITIKNKTCRNIMPKIRLQNKLINNTVKKIKIRKRKLKRIIIHHYKTLTRRIIETDKLYTKRVNFVFNLNYKYIGD